MGEFDDFLGIEVDGVWREGGAGGVFDALVDGEDGHVAGAGEAAGVEEELHVAEDIDGSVGHGHDAVDEVGAREVEGGAGDAFAFVVEECGVVGEEFGGGGHGLAPWEGGV